ncbi:hypothetical protein [Leptospira wolffii]|uniref:hypothetical protein n=1 Tax=Leptospira wolffii TaxID=409998 RepID=UPI0002EA948A|nr:hypothetical protein [Leptospira wolffii]EPG65774.1 hypothetical protein LEP1GSC061_0021 [Leptospira wolffii serovar Khorat str. Khorat-H2]
MKQKRKDLLQAKRAHKKWRRDPDAFTIGEWKFSTPDFHNLSEVQNQTPKEAREKNSVYEEREFSKPYIPGDWWYATRENRIVYFVISTPEFYASSEELEVEAHLENEISDRFGIPYPSIHSRRIHLSNLWETRMEMGVNDLAIERIVKQKIGINMDVLSGDLDRINGEGDRLSDIKIRSVAKNDFIITIPNSWFFEKTYGEILQICLKARASSRPYVSKWEELSYRIRRDGIFDWPRIQKELQRSGSQMKDKKAL